MSESKYKALILDLGAFVNYTSITNVDEINYFDRKKETGLEIIFS